MFTAVFSCRNRLTVKPIAPVLAMALLVAGCDSDPVKKAEIVKTVSVSGTVTYNGQPLDLYQVVLTPEDGQRPASGMTDAAGKFTLGTNSPGDGAVVGKCKVTVSYVGPPQNAEPGREDPNYKAPPPKVKVPPKYSNSTKSGVTVDIPAGGTSDLKIELKD